MCSIPLFSDTPTQCQSTNPNFKFPVKNRIKYRNKCILLAQKIIRGYLARKQHQPRYKGILKIKAIKVNLSKTEEIANQLRNNKDSILKQVKDVEQLIDRSVAKIKVTFRV